MDNTNSRLLNVIDVIKKIEKGLNHTAYVSLHLEYKSLAIRAEWKDGRRFQLIFDEIEIAEMYAPDMLIDFFISEANRKKSNG